MFGGLDFGELRHGKADRQQEQCHSEEIHIETDNGIGLLRRALRDGGGGRAENHASPNPREHRSAQRIKGLRENQAARRGFGTSQYRNIGVRGNLKNRNARCQNNQRRQKKWKRGDFCGRIEPKTCDHHQQQSHDDRLLVSEPVDNLGRWNGKDEIGQEESSLNQHALGKTEIEDMLSVGDQHVVE